ncbi:MAG: DUF4160 domain-containing protein [Gammaproteobacteria bacterium]|nr:DUF4160 domain-containing protein [Gammaproteobacteria bacterium]
MPTILRIGPYRFFFYSNEQGEPPHIHVQREDRLAKYWLMPVSLASSTRFPVHELRLIQRRIKENRDLLMEAYLGYFDGKH